MISKAHALVICVDDSRIEEGANALLIGGPGGGKTHHATIFDINVDSYRRRTAFDRKNKVAGRPLAYATVKHLEAVSRADNQPPA